MVILFLKVTYVCCNGDRMELVKICYGEFDVIELEKYRRVDSVKGWYCDVLITDEMSLMRPYNIRLPLNNFYIEHWNMEIVRVLKYMTSILI